MFNPRPPQHPACGSARGVSAGLKRSPLRAPPKLVTKAGRQDRFTWSGAVRPMRSARLTLCRRFRPSPCPTHYGGHWATTPSADCCAITPRRYHRVRCSDHSRVRWVLHAFRRGPQSGSRGHHRELRVRWRIQAFQPGPQFDSHRHTGRLLHSSPRIRTCAVGAQPPHLPCPWTPWALSSGADSPQG